MKSTSQPSTAPVIANRHPGLMEIVLNRPQVLNSLSLEMVQLIRQMLNEAEKSPDIRLVVLRGNGPKGFCAGGDIKKLVQAVKNDAIHRAMQFFAEEYALDLCLHRFPKPVITMADGITMGGGLGLSAGTDVVVATERTRMAMPETRIGFFPDIGATGWMFKRCSEGYPEYIGLSGYLMQGAECVRVGFADTLIDSTDLAAIFDKLTAVAPHLAPGKSAALRQLKRELPSLAHQNIEKNNELDQWVRTHFAGKVRVTDILDALSAGRTQDPRCDQTLQTLAELSPTALVVTLRMLRHNQDRPIEEVFEADKKASHFMVTHPDYIEGVRARILDKDNQPRWQPDTLEAVGEIDLNF